MNIKKVILAVILFSSSPLAFGSDGENALIQASRSGDVNEVPLLLENGADIHAKNNEGKNACDMGRQGIWEFLSREIAEKNSAVRKLLGCGFW